MMRPVSFQILSALPALLGVLCVMLSASQLHGGALSYTPNVAWLMTLVMASHYPPSWPRGFAFLLGLLQDVLFGTPLGSQAVLALLLAQFVNVQGERNQALPFRMRWLEAACVILVWHVMLYALMHLAGFSSANFKHLLAIGLINALWYPLFYAAATRLFAALPDAT